MLGAGFITHENERHHDVPWGAFGGTPGQVGRVELYNHTDRDGTRRDEHAKFSAIKVAPGDVHVFYGPCGGGFGDPLERPAQQVLEDVLDGFYTEAYARDAYGVVLDLDKEVVDQAATDSLRAQLRSSSRPYADMIVTPVIDAANDDRPKAMPGPAKPIAAAAPARPAAPAANDDTAAIVARLKASFGDDWSFDILRHSTYGETVEVHGQLRANGSTARETGRVNGDGHGTLGRRLQQAADDSLRRCAEQVLARGNDRHAAAGDD
jgi:hypothetical protein